MGRPSPILDRMPLRERADAPAARAGFQILYADTDGKLYRVAGGAVSEVGASRLLLPARAVHSTAVITASGGSLAYTGDEFAADIADAKATPPADWTWRAGSEANAASAAVASGELQIVGQGDGKSLVSNPAEGPHLSLPREWRIRGFDVFWRCRLVSSRANDGCGVAIYDSVGGVVAWLLQNAAGGRVLIKRNLADVDSAAIADVTAWTWGRMRVNDSLIECSYSIAAALPTTEAGWTKLATLAASPWVATSPTLDVAVGLSLDGAGAGAPEGRFQRIGFFDPTQIVAS